MQNIPSGVFKAYDIRGLVDSQLTNEFAYGLGKALGTLLARETHKDQPVVVVGEDMRPTSPTFSDELTRGLQEVGAQVLRVGLVSTPAFYFAVSYLNADGGAMVSASHNPAEYNGFKIVRARGVPVGGGTGLQTLRQMMEADDFSLRPGGSFESVGDIARLHAENEVAVADVGDLPSYRMICDSANGMGAQYLDELFKLLPATVERMFWDFDGTFPNHEADPFKEENTEAIRHRIKEAGADIGIATDGDGDRIFFIDDKGELVDPAIVRGLVARAVLRRYPGAKICYDIRPGKITEDMIREAGGVPIVTKVGHALIKDTMLKEDAVFAGESSGHFYFRLPQGSFEAPLVTLLFVLGEMKRENKPLSEIVAPLRKYAHSGEINFKVADKEAVLAQLKSTFADAVQSDLDGLSFTYSDFWFNVRASNTEPLLRLNLEAVSQEVMQAKTAQVRSIIEA
ncbi:phosphomannomutase/phosphoglucomutase [Patescibacteria group bacterium]|nr:phosphomannomutase/phosphoglucomutase [Patescibacteria group bacterium]